MTYTIHFDGACELNPTNGRRNPGGIATYGWLIKQGGRHLAHGYGEAARGEGSSNNVAEYTALIKALQAARDLGILDQITVVQGDSQLVVNQVNGLWNCNKEHLFELRKQARALLPSLVRLRWVPREQNEEADELSKKAYAEALKRDGGPWGVRLKSRVVVKEMV